MLSENSCFVCWDMALLFKHVEGPPSSSNITQQLGAVPTSPNITQQLAAVLRDGSQFCLRSSAQFCAVLRSSVHELTHRQTLPKLVHFSLLPTLSHSQDLSVPNLLSTLLIHLTFGGFVI